MPKTHFDLEGFYSALDAERQSRRLTWKKVAEQSGVSASTLTRMAQGRRPDVDSLSALLNWSGFAMDNFVKGDKENKTEPDTLAQITAYLRADANLTTEGTAALEAIIKAGYEQLRQDKENQ
jgi:transcriptional regulator with XRE-family HTH domain